MRRRLCNCGKCHRCKHRQYAAEYKARQQSGTVGVVGGKRKCDCGACKLCLHREAVYQRGIRLAREHPNLGADLEESRLNAYFDRIKSE